MSLRIILSLAASAIIGIGKILGRYRLTPPHIALVSAAAVSIAVAFTAVAFTVVATTVVYAQEWRSASVLPLSAPLRSALPPRVLITAPAITVLPPRSVVRTAIIITRPTTVVSPRHNSCPGLRPGGAERLQLPRNSA